MCIFCWVQQGKWRSYLRAPCWLFPLPRGVPWPLRLGIVWVQGWDGGLLLLADRVLSVGATGPHQPGMRGKGQKAVGWSTALQPMHWNCLSPVLATPTPKSLEKNSRRRMAFAQRKNLSKAIWGGFMQYTFQRVCFLVAEIETRKLVTAKDSIALYASA